MKKRKNKLTTNILYGITALLLIGAAVGLLNGLTNDNKKEEHICNNYTISDDAIVETFGYYFTDDEGIPYNSLSPEINERYNKAVAKGHNQEHPPYGSYFVDAKSLPEYVTLSIYGLNVGTTYSVSIILSCSNYDSLSEYLDGPINFNAYNYEDGSCYGSVDVDSLNIKNEKNSCEFAEFNFRKIKLFDATYNYEPESYAGIGLYLNDIPEDEYLYLAQIVFEPIASSTYSLRNSHQNIESESITYHEDDDESERYIEWGPLG